MLDTGCIIQMKIASNISCNFQIHSYRNRLIQLTQRTSETNISGWTHGLAQLFFVHLCFFLEKANHTPQLSLMKAYYECDSLDLL